ncbi:MAG: isoprenylcysteine carboxylmethyltransferase family protein [Chloroflexi bacterium]|nr:MAG: isoprenylcysteine carboxylmethyltransferase family protein [Chloroflexota bacterium]
MSGAGVDRPIPFAPPTPSNTGEALLPNLSLLLRNLAFTVGVPGTVSVLVPYLILADGGHPPHPVGWPGLALIAAGLALYGWCMWLFATIGRGTPGPWDAPRRLVVAGPYRWVRNPIYVGVLLVILGEAWLFGSWSLVIYAAGAAVFFHLAVLAYEEPTLRANFPADYEDYFRTVHRWIPRPPGPA